jgi:F420-dependent oxidoreductase-like protein
LNFCNRRYPSGVISPSPANDPWHGVNYDKPLTRTREYVEIVRKVLKRDEPVTFEGYHYQLPLTGPNTTGAGKPLKSVAHTNPQQPIFLASISPGGLRCAAEIADGVLLSFLDPNDTFEIVDKHLAEGFAKPTARGTREDFTVSTFANVVVNDDVQGVMDFMKPAMARQLGGMGSKSKNFYAEFARRMGYDDEVEQIQSLYLSGEKEKAATVVPEALIDSTCLIGPEERIRERLGPWREAEQRGSLDMMLLTTVQPEALELMASEFL